MGLLYQGAELTGCQIVTPPLLWAGSRMGTRENQKAKKKILSICFSTSKIGCIEIGENTKILAIYGDCREAII
jgi:hypothetical protein